MRWISRCRSLAQIRDARRETRIPQFLLPPINFKSTMRQMSVPPMHLLPSRMLFFSILPTHPPLILCSPMSNSKRPSRRGLLSRGRRRDLPVRGAGYEPSATACSEPGEPNDLSTQTPDSAEKIGQTRWHFVTEEPLGWMQTS